jgi:hypothetical protein
MTDVELLASEAVGLATAVGTILHTDLVCTTGRSVTPVFARSAVLDLVVVAAMCVGFALKRVVLVMDRDTEATIDVLAIERASLRLFTILDDFPIPMRSTFLELFVVTANFVSSRTLLIQAADERVTATATTTGLLREAVRSISTILSRLPVSMHTADLQIVVRVATASVNGRALLVVQDERMTIAAAIGSFLGKTESSLGAVLDRIPVAVVAALLQAVIDVAAVVVDGGALCVAAADERVAVTFSSLLGEAVCGLTALFDGLPFTVVATHLESVVVAAMCANGARVVGRCRILTKREGQDGREERYILGETHDCGVINACCWDNPKTSGGSSKESEDRGQLKMWGGRKEVEARPEGFAKS